MGFWDWLTGDADPGAEKDEARPAPRPPTADDIERALATAETMAAEGRAPAPVTSRVRRVTGTVRRILPRIAASGVESADAYTVVATATDYLPESLNSYLRLPRDWADTRPVEGGKSSLLLLIDQLDLLAATMTRMDDAINRHDATALVAQGRFLEDRFGVHRARPVALDPTRSTSTNPLDLEGRQ